MNIQLIDRTRALRRQVPGRIVQAIADIERLEAYARYPALEPVMLGAQADARGHLETRTRREAQVESRNDGEAGEVDAEADIELAGVYDTSKRYATRMPNTPKGKAGARILRLCFRRGLAAVTNAPYETELLMVEYIHELLTTVLADEVERLGLTTNVEQIGEIVPRYRAALAMEDRITAADVAAAYEAMQVSYFRLAFGIVALVDDADDCAALMAPIFEQDARLAAIYAARRAGRSIADVIDDPDAGAEAVAPGDGAPGDGLDPGAGFDPGADIEPEADIEPGGGVPGDGGEAEPGADAPGDGGVEAEPGAAVPEGDGVEAEPGSDAPGGAGGESEPGSPPLRPIPRPGGDV